MKKTDISIDDINALFEKDELINSPEKATFVFKTHENLGYPPRFHTAMEIYFVLSGSIGANINNKNYVVKTGEILVVNPLEIHQYYRIDKATVSVFIFDNKYLADFYEIYKDKIFPTVLKDVEYNKNIMAIMSDIAPSYPGNNTSGQLSPLSKKAHVNLVLDKIITRYGLCEMSEPTDKILNIILYIYENLNKKITLDSLAEQFHYSKATLSRLFTKYLRTDLRKFINDLRAEQVHHLISNEKYKTVSTLQIAISCGFESPATFYRAYKRRYDSLPIRN